jgi:transcriptional/translational regulatory protein YebC/TACO1
LEKIENDDDVQNVYHTMMVWIQSLNKLFYI